MNKTLTPKIIRSKRRTIALHISRDGELVVKAPLLIPGFMIQRFIDQNNDWIIEHMGRVQKKPKPQSVYGDGEMLDFLGKKIRLTIGNFSKIEVKGDQLLFPKALEFRMKKEIEIWYITEARRIITQQVNFYAPQMKVTHNGLTFSDTTSQWGRCTHDNRLQFSWRLVMAPILTINYVVVHELAHIMEKNHSRNFWAKVRYFNPSYRQQIKWLKENGNDLF